MIGAIARLRSSYRSDGWSGEIGIRACLRSMYREVWEFESPLQHKYSFDKIIPEDNKYHELFLLININQNSGSKLSVSICNN